MTDAAPITMESIAHEYMTSDTAIRDLAEAESNLRSLFGHMPGIVIESDAEAVRVIARYRSSEVHLVTLARVGDSIRAGYDNDAPSEFAFADDVYGGATRDYVRAESDAWARRQARAG